MVNTKLRADIEELEANFSPTPSFDEQTNDGAFVITYHLASFNNKISYSYPILLAIFLKNSKRSLIT